MTRTRTVVNLEVKLGRTLGTRRPPSDPLVIRPGEQEDARAWKRAFGTPRIPKGLYRFASHEEADAWLMKMITRPARPGNAANPFASPQTLWKMKQTVRERDIPDRLFLRHKLAEMGTPVPEPPAPIFLPRWLDRLRRWLVRLLGGE